MVTLTGVCKWYAESQRVLDQVNLEIKRGDFLYLIGGTGAGKSSLLRMIATEESPSSGSISLFGYNLATASPSTLRAIRQALGYIPQNIRLIPDLTVEENVALSLTLAGRRANPAPAQARARVAELLERLGLIAKRSHLARSISGGEAQRVAIARALVRSPELIVADEPTGSQDRDHTWLLMDLFLKANVTGSAVVLATHDREIVRRVRKRSAFLKNGHVAVESGGEAPCIY